VDEPVSASATATATTFGFGVPRIVFGAGAASEAGDHLGTLGVTRAFVVCDRFVIDSGVGAELAAMLRTAGIESVLHPVEGEPTETSVREAAAAVDGSFDGFVGVGGGSAIDTAKICALLGAHGGDLLDWVNAPLGSGRPVPGPLRPVLALPTTSGTGSEVTTVAIVDFPSLGTKTGISHRFLQPSLAVVDPLLTTSCPPGVTAATGLDALLHALEAYTTLPFDRRPALPPAERPPYQGANPFSDPLCERVFGLVAKHLRTAVHDGANVEARTAMSLAATTAGVAFSVAGVHVPHALAYPIASLGHRWQPPGYGGAAFVPHGYAVAVTAPASFRLLQEAVGERARTAARLLDAEDDLAGALETLMRDVGAPTSLTELGYGEDDLEAIVAGALEQRRLLVGAPAAIGRAELETVLRDSL
jgi:alcohol dehydrogenase class IV